MSAAVAVDVGRTVLGGGPRAVQLILRTALPLANPGRAHETRLGLRRLPLHHVLRHEHGGGPLLSNAVYLTVNEYHDDSRGEEGHQAGGEDVPCLVVEETLLCVRVILPVRPQILFVGH